MAAPHRLCAAREMERHDARSSAPSRALLASLRRRRGVLEDCGTGNDGVEAGEHGSRGRE
jgi:hypothetical protein